LETRLVLAVGLLAVAAVATVAMATRQGARREFQRFLNLERRIASKRGLDHGQRLARALDGRCCPAGWDGEARGLLLDDEALLVLEGNDHIVASTGRPLDSAARVEARSADGVLVVDVERGPARDQISLNLLDPGGPLHLSDGRDARLYVVPFPPQDGERHSAAFLGSLDQRVLLATMLVAVLAVAATAAIARRIVGPLQELSRAARDLGSGNLERRVAVRGSGELAELGSHFNAMAADLERQQLLRRNLVHDVAHELRTPLTAIRCRLEALIDGMAPDPKHAYVEMRAEVLHLGTLVDDLQEVALAEARELRLEPTVVPALPLVGSAARAAGIEGDPRLRFDLAPGLTLHADAMRMRQVLLNLLTNANRHTPADGSILVRGFADAGDVVVEVRNTGSHLTEEQLGRVFDRFYRTDPARERATGGSGLGLAIVKNLVEAHGGRVWARSDEVGVVVGFAVPGTPPPTTLE
jgi:signal transduction histidine kinase